MYKRQGTYQFQIPGVEVQDMDILGMQHEANACRVGNSVVPMFGVGRKMCIRDRFRIDTGGNTPNASADKKITW